MSDAVAEAAGGLHLAIDSSGSSSGPRAGRALRTSGAIAAGGLDGTLELKFSNFLEGTVARPRAAVASLVGCAAQLQPTRPRVRSTRRTCAVRGDGATHARRSSERSRARGRHCLAAPARHMDACGT